MHHPHRSALKPLVAIRSTLLAAVTLCALASPDAAATRSSSGGYSRPSIAAPSRPPPSSSAPISSGGYSRSSTTSASVAPPKASAGDQSITQSSSGDALRALRSAPPAGDQPSKKRPGFLPGDVTPSPPIAAVAAAPAPTQTTVIIHHDHWWSGWGSLAPVYVPVPVQIPAATYTAPAPPLDPAPTGTAAPQPARRHGHRWIWWVLGFGAAGGLAYVGWHRMQASDRKTTGAAAFVGNYTAVKAEAEPPRSSRYRAGMVIDIDAAALILGKDQTLVDQHATGPATVLRVEALRIGGQPFVRLHTSRALVQIHEAADGSIDDARLFTLRDSVMPSDADEWSFWLDGVEGVIGLGTFEDKDGRIYARMWAPSDDPASRVAPREIWGDTARGVAMLYGRPTELPEPAPQVDLLLIETDEANGGARVILYAGVDLDPASLSIV